MGSIGDVVAALSTEVPLSRAAEWDAVGLQIGDPGAAADSVAVCHEVTTDVVDTLEREPVDLLISYHALLFRSVKSFTADSSPAGRAFRLARSGVALAVVHTAFDVARGGSADSLAAALGMGDISGFGPAWGAGSVKFVTFVPAGDADTVADAMFGAGAGVIGNYSGCSYRIDGIGTFEPQEGARPVAGTSGTQNREHETRLEMVASASQADRVAAALVAAHPYEEPAYDVYDVKGNAAMVGRVGTIAEVSLGDLVTTTAAALGGSPRLAGHPQRRVERVAVVPGSGSSFIAAIGGAADVLITGDVGHHEARAALDGGLAIIDAGHIPTERPGLRSLYAAVLRVAPGARTLLDDPHPWEAL